MNPPMTPQDYAAAVRAALADLPARDREALLEDLDDHLAEVAAEPGMPSLEERLGTPEAYAAELRAAYGGRPAGGRTRLTGRMRDRSTGVVRRVHTRLLGLPPYRQAAGFAPELRPAWWVLRGYVVALAVLAPLGAPGLVPGDLAAWVFTLAVVWGSVWLGRHARTGTPGWGRLLLAGVNVLVAVLVIATMADVPSTSSRSVSFDFGSPRPAVGPRMPAGVYVETVATLNGEVYNIFPYAEDGTPLHNVRLYDQDGRPITLDLEMSGQSLVIPCEGEPPIRNSYPLPLRSQEPRENGLPEETRDCDPAAGTTLPPGAPTPTAPTPTAPAEASGSPEPTASASPEEPAASPSGSKPGHKSGR